MAFSARVAPPGRRGQEDPEVTVATKVSSCVDCATPIIGDRPRCAGCHQRHAALVAIPLGDDDMTTPRPRLTDGDTMPDFLARWVVGLELIVIVVLGLILAVRGCLS